MFMKFIITAIVASFACLSAIAFAAPQQYQNGHSTNQQQRNHERYQSNQNSRERGQRNSQAQGYGHQRYKAPSTYKRPKGYSSHNWARGERMPSSYRGHRYRIDYSDYRLRQPPRGQRWIRVNNDVFLTVIETGLIVEVVRSLFY